jgi:hypothetical protein
LKGRDLKITPPPLNIRLKTGGGGTIFWKYYRKNSIIIFGE